MLSIAGLLYQLNMSSGQHSSSCLSATPRPSQNFCDANADARSVFGS